MAITQKQRLEEAYEIHSRFHSWMGFLVCDGEEDLLALRKLIKKIEREAVNRCKRNLKRNLYEDDWSGWKNKKYVEHVIGIFNESMKTGKVSK